MYDLWILLSKHTKVYSGINSLLNNVEKNSVMDMM